MHPARQAYVEEENGPDDTMEGIDYASVRKFSNVHLIIKYAQADINSIGSQPRHAWHRQ